MAVLKDLIVHGPSRFLNGIQTDSLKANTIDAKNGYFKYLKAIDGDIENLSVEELLAQKATVVGLLDIKGELHTNTWTNSNIANIGGVFYISPTVISTSANVVIGGNENSRTLTVSGGSFATTTVPTWNGTTESTSGWVIGSRVMVTGSVTYNNVEYPLGTCIGYISGALTSSGFTVQQISSEALESIFAITGTNSLSGTNIQISMYEIGPGNNNNQSNNASYKPVGILMTSYGMADKSTHIDIYGGVNAKNTSSKTSGMADPNVRIGHLSGLDSYTDSAGNTRQPTGWGIYTDNGYFKGVVVADSGSIGKFTINSKAIYSDTHSAWNTSSQGIFIGTNDTNYYISGGSGASWWIRDDGRFQFGGTNGITYDGSILKVPAANVSGALTAATMETNLLTALNTKISALTATTATIGSWTISKGVMQHATVGGSGGVWISADTDTSSNVTVGNSGAIKTWRLLVNNTFGVTTAGKLYASGADISGKITATSFEAQGYSGTTLQRKTTVDSTGLNVYDGSNNLLAQFGTTSTIGRTSGNNYNIYIDNGAISLRYNTNVLNKIDTSGMKLYLSSDQTNAIANFGSTVVIGKTNSNNIQIKDANITFYKNGVTLATIEGGNYPSFHIFSEGLDAAKYYGNSIILTQVENQQYLGHLDLMAPLSDGDNLLYSEDTNGIKLIDLYYDEPNAQAHLLLNGSIMARGMAGQIIMTGCPAGGPGSSTLVPANNTTIYEPIPGWLICNGAAVSRTTYATLFAVIGTTYGTGNGSTTFNLPDFRGRVGVGGGTSTATGATNHTLNQKAGEETHVLTPGETAMKAHDHGIEYNIVYRTTASSGGGVRNVVSGGSSTTSTLSTTAANGSAHNNMQPYIGINYIICTGKTY